MSLQGIASFCPSPKWSYSLGPYLLSHHELINDQFQALRHMSCLQFITKRGTKNVLFLKPPFEADEMQQPYLDLPES